VKISALLLGLLAYLLTITGARAEPPQDGEAVGLTEIVVTAQKRNEDIQSVGASITAISGADLVDSRIKEPVDISTLTPGLSTLNMTADGNPAFAIRGVGLDDFNPNNSSGTAVYLDGIYQSAPGFLQGQLFDVSRVEVLKGPQGTLYGRNATGGAVSIVSNAPTDTPEGYFTAGYGRWQTFEASGAVSGPLGENFRGRFAGTITEQGQGWQQDTDSGRRFGQTRVYATRTQLEFKPSDQFSTLLSVHFNRDLSTPSSYQADRVTVPGCPICVSEWDTGTTNPTLVKVGAMDLYRDIKGDGASLTTRLSFDFADLVSILGFDELDFRNSDNNNGIPAPIYDLYQHDFVRQAYEETRLVSTQRLFDETDWILGTSYSWQKFHGQDASDQSTLFVGLFETPPDLTTRGLSVAQANYIQKPTSFGLFFNTTTHLSESLRLIAGGRYSNDRVSVDGATTETGSADGGVTFQGIGSIVTALDTSHEVNSFSYRIGPELDLSPNVLYYANISTATKSGQFYLGPALSPGGWSYASPEKLTAFETGLKTSLFDRRLLLNSSIYYYDYVDRQSGVLFIAPTTGLIAGALANVPKSRIDGIDLDVTARPFRSLTLKAGLNFLDSRVTHTLTEVNGDPLVSALPVGAPLAQAPRFTGLMSGTYEHAVGDGLTALAHLDYRWVDAQKNTLADPMGEYGPFGSLNARFALTSSSGWEVGIWGKNLTNSNAIINAYSGFVGRTIYRMQPVSYGADVGYRF
jgi:iron complex outermembrane receptor protein